VNVIISGRPRGREEFGAAVTVGGLTLEVPPGVTVTGTARVAYVGGTALPLRAAEVPVALRVPAPSFADEWELVAAVLSEIDGAAQAERLRALRADACAPLGPGCTLDEFAAEAARGASEPAGRWPALQHQADPARSFARFLRHLAVAFTWDGDVEYEEYARLSRLLSRVYAPGAAPPGVQGRCGGS
ncbi:MAG TPA: hypothetical protein VFO85_13105, partial [Vicinamibacteria bacterium]|nr:hypothetical protein [Vicinamibacteria bacterium]